MPRERRPSFLGRLLELPLRLLFAIGILIVKGILLVRQVVPASLLLLLCALIPLIGFSMRWLDGTGSWLVLAAALILAFAAGASRNRR